MICSISKDDFVSDSHYIGPNEPNDGSFLWEDVPNAPSDTVRIRIRSFDDPTIFDLSDDYFSIVEGPEKTITVTSPNGGEEWTAGFKYNINWVSQDVPGPLLIEYSKDNFVSDINTIVASTENDGVFQWQVPEDPSTTVKIRITDLSDPTVSDTSDSNFTILQKPTITIIVPNGGEVWDVGAFYDITWESVGAVSNVRIGYSKDDFVDDVHEIVASTSNDGVFEWQIPNDPSDTVKIGIVDTNYTSVYDVSDDNFTISYSQFPALINNCFLRKISGFVESIQIHPTMDHPISGGIADLSFDVSLFQIFPDGDEAIGESAGEPV